MHCYELHQEQLLPTDLDTAWSFFTSPQNLENITPPDLGFNIIGDPPTETYNGQIIRYRIGVAPLYAVNWVTEIKHLEHKRCFVDEQRAGPYRFWYHRHAFEAVDGGVRMTDHVVYAMPFGPLGRIVHKLWVQRTLNKIFSYRRKVLDELFPASPAMEQRDQVAKLAS